MIENGGKLDGERLLGKKSVKLMTTNQVSKDAGWVTFGNQIREELDSGMDFQCG